MRGASVVTLTLVLVIPGLGPPGPAFGRPDGRLRPRTRNPVSTGHGVLDSGFASATRSLPLGAPEARPGGRPGMTQLKDNARQQRRAPQILQLPIVTGPP